MLLRQSRQKLLFAAIAILACAFLGAPYGLAVSGFQLSGLMRGFLTGLLVSAPIIFFEVVYSAGPAGRWVRRLPIWRLSLIRIALFVAAIAVGDIAAHAIVFGQPFSEEEGVRGILYTLAFSLVAVVILNFFLVIDRMLGRAGMKNVLTGHYHRPQSEDRIFLFVDIVGSTGIAEQIGALRFHQLMNDVIFDVTPSIVEAGGEIYRYVGDEVIATWMAGRPRDNGRVFDAYLDIMRRLSARRRFYRAHYGVDLAVRAAMHRGRVIAGELGDWKREITFIGDTVNTTARIEIECKERDLPAIASADLIETSTVPAALRQDPLGIVPIRGRVGSIELVALHVQEE